MKSHKKKMIAPIVVSVIIIIYYIIYFCILISLVDGIWKILLGTVPVILSVITLKVCIERIREIKEGEEDDIGKY